MKRKLQEGFVPRWRKQIEAKHKNITKKAFIKVLVEAPAWVQPQPTHPPSQTNHERVKATREFREQKQKLLRELVKKTKEANPDKKQSYRQWVLQAVSETKQAIYD